MTADTKHADLLRRLADEAIREIEPNPDDPVLTLILDRHRLFHLYAARDLEHEAELRAECDNQLDDLDREIVAATAKTRTGLLLQLRLLNHESFSNENHRPLIEAVCRGICYLVPLSPKQSGRDAPP
jgi:hypothetical protein